MNRKTITAVLLSGVLGMPFVVGCDREISHKETVRTTPGGAQVKDEKTTVEHPDGSVTTERQKVRVDPGNP